MKLHELINEEKEVNLVWQSVGDKTITPEMVYTKWDGKFVCSNKKLTSLEGAPKTIDGDFWCNNNHLTSLKGAPERVTGGFDCSSNRLTSLEGAPKKIGSYFFCDNNNLTSLQNIHKMITEINGDFYCHKNKITSHVLGLLLIPGIKNIVASVDEFSWVKILNRYLGKGRKGMLDCQNELIEAGLEEYAQL